MTISVWYRSKSKNNGCYSSHNATKYCSSTLVLLKLSFFPFRIKFSKLKLMMSSNHFFLFFGGFDEAPADSQKKVYSCFHHLSSTPYNNLGMWNQWCAPLLSINCGIQFICQDGLSAFILYTCALNECVCLYMSTCHAVVHICVKSAIIEMSLSHSERRHRGERESSEAKYWSMNAQYFSPIMTTTQVGSMQRRRTKRLKWIYSSPIGGWMCRRWSDDHLCSLLKWNMMARELSSISCLAQEAPIWSWVLSVLCCCVVIAFVTAVVALSAFIIFEVSCRSVEGNGGKRNYLRCCVEDRWGASW